MNTIRPLSEVELLSATTAWNRDAGGTGTEDGREGGRWGQTPGNESYFLEGDSFL